MRVDRLRRQVITAGLAGLLVVVLSAGPLVALAQDGKRAERLAWDDAPVLPRHRSQADWLVDVGWQTPAEVYGPFRTREYAVTEQESFIPLGSFDTTAPFVLRCRTAHAYFWFELDTPVDQAALEAAAAFFEDHIWPLNRRLFGEVDGPGIDGDPRLHIVNQATIAPSVMGAFSPDDQCPQFLCPASNQRDIIYINLDVAPVNSQEYLTTLAHEHQHLLRHHLDGNEFRWLNEGLSQLTEHLNGFHPYYVGGNNLRDFLHNPDHHLNGWTSDAYEQGRYYGASYLFLLYLYERFGLETIQALSASEYDGLAAVHHALRRSGQAASVNDVFRDWMVANYLDDPYVGDGRYYYQSLDLPVPIRPQQLDAGGPPITGDVNQYGADYLALSAPGTYEIGFDGQDAVSILDVAPASGDWMWWSYHGDSSAARLTGAFDLSGVDTATLHFDAWWQIEQDYDRLHVLVSADGGQSWEVVGGKRAVAGGDDAPGPYYTGQSAGWVTEQIDLSPYAGRAVLVRFEYLTDSSRTLAGIALDNVRIPALGYADDVEEPESVWHAEGFLRITDTVTQHWAVALVQRPADGPATVQWMALDALNTGRATLQVAQGSTATIVVGAMAPFTDRPGSYKLSIQPR
jgi:immune inhibitor A